jgi:hypothetical protein
MDRKVGFRCSLRADSRPLRPFSDSFTRHLMNKGKENAGATMSDPFNSAYTGTWVR